MQDAAVVAWARCEVACKAVPPLSSRERVAQPEPRSIGERVIVERSREMMEGVCDPGGAVTDCRIDHAGRLERPGRHLGCERANLDLPIVTLERVRGRKKRERDTGVAVAPRK